MSNVKKLIANGVETRAAIIVINQDTAAVERTKRFLQDLGVRHFRASETREFGRGEKILFQKARLSGLCGHCWAGKLCVAPDGMTYPCVMARQWPVGNVREAPLAAIARGKPLEDMRKAIFEEVWRPRVDGQRRAAASQDCAPYSDEAPELPETCRPSDVERESEQCLPCPQSCAPDFEHCLPNTCPQSCVPFEVVCEPGG